MPLRLVTDGGASRATAAEALSPRPPSSWLAGLVWTVGPAAPTTALDEGTRPVLNGAARVGGAVEFSIRIENHQAASSLVRPMVSLLAGASGIEWSPIAEITPKPLILRPGERAPLSIVIQLGDRVPPGRYRGGLFLLGVRSPAIEIVISVGEETG